MKSWRVPIFFPNWLGDFAIQDGDCCFPPTRPARSIRSHEDETDGVDGRGKNRGKQGIKHTRRGREPRGQAAVCGLKGGKSRLASNDRTLSYSLESDIRQTLVTLYAIHALETSRDRSWIDLERPEKPPVTL
jgi:hypothetical protein